MQLLPLLCAVVLTGQGSLQDARELVKQFGSWQQNNAVAALEKFPPEIRHAALLEGLSDPNPEVQNHSAFYVQRYRDEKTKLALAKFLPKSQGNGRVWAVYYLARTDYQIPVEIIEAMLGGDMELQRAALTAIERQKRTELTRHAGAMLGSSDTNVVNGAQRALVALGEPGFREVARRLEQGGEQERLHAVGAIHEMPAEWRKRLLRVALSDRSDAVLRTALSALGQIPEPDLLPLILRAAESDDSEVVFPAMHALGQVRDPRSRRALLKLVQKERYAETAVYALARQGDPASLEPLIRNQNPKVRRAFSESVIRYGVVSLPYVGRLFDDNTESTRLAFVRSINKERLEPWEPEARERLVKLLESRLYDPSPDVQNSTIRALALLGKEAKLPAAPKTEDLRRLAGAIIWDQSGYAVAALGLAGEDALLYLLPLLNHSEGAVRARAVAALAIVRDPRTFDRLGEMFGDPDPDVSMAIENAFVAIGEKGLEAAVRAAAHHWHAMGAIAKMRPRVDDKIGALLRSDARDLRLGALRTVGSKDEYLGEVTRLLADPDREIRYYAALALVRRRDPAAIPVLVELLPAMPREERLEIIQSLGCYPGKHGLAELSELYRSRSWERRYVVAEAIVRRYDVDSLLPLLRDSVASIREKALFSLGHSKDERAVEPVRKLVADPIPEVRRSAMHAMAQLKDVGGLDIVLARLNDPDRDVRWVAASVLGSLGDPRAVPALIRVVESRDDYTCGQAAVSLGQIGDRRATPVLLSLLEDPDPYNRRFAARALGDLGDPAAIPALQEHSKELDSEVARDAREALARIRGETP